jgi:hypothetical protein
MHPIFRFGPDEGENDAIWGRLTPMYWYSSKYGAKRHAEVLAVHPIDNAEFKDANQPEKHPLVVHMHVGGRSMFFGFDETWRWRRGDDESKFENFWVQTLRYLARGRSTRTELKLDRQTPYRVGDKIKVTVKFPENTPGGGGGGGGNDPTGFKLTDTTKVKVTVVHTAPDGKVSERAETIELKKLDGSWGAYESIFGEKRTREGKYKFKLTEPEEVKKTQPDGEMPSAEAIVELPPGELEKLRMNHQEMEQAAYQTDGRFYTLANADQLLVDFQRGSPTIVSSQADPTLLWNQLWVFGLIVLLITAEWVLRKMKHLL